MTQSSKCRRFLFRPSLSDGKGQLCAKTCLTSAKLCSCVQGLSIYPPSGFNYCVRIMSQIQSALSLTLNLYGASITKPTASTAHTSCPGVTSGPSECVCVRVCVFEICVSCTASYHINQPVLFSNWLISLSVCVTIGTISCR